MSKTAPVMLVEPRLYFAYGSNLNLRQMAERCPNAKPVGVHRLEGWRLVFKGGADIVPDSGCAVLGALYGLTIEEEASLDLFEGYPSTYTQHPVLDVDGREAFFLYKKRSIALKMPTVGYLNIIRQGYHDWGLDTAQLEEAVRFTSVHRSTQPFNKHSSRA